MRDLGQKQKGPGKTARPFLNSRSSRLVFSAVTGQANQASSQQEECRRLRDRVVAVTRIRIRPIRRSVVAVCQSADLAIAACSGHGQVCNVSINGCGAGLAWPFGKRVDEITAGVIKS